jgi:nitrate reductase assembly molybdenum cofactor insertion protein NarJ
VNAATSTFKLASVLLQYPTAELFAGLDELDRFARAESGPKPASRYAVLNTTIAMPRLRVSP